MGADAAALFAVDMPCSTRETSCDSIESRLPICRDLRSDSGNSRGKLGAVAGAVAGVNIGAGVGVGVRVSRGCCAWALPPPLWMSAASASAAANANSASAIPALSLYRAKRRRLSEVFFIGNP